ncbi:MAG: serine hydrolase [Candidatus Promineifilaceae bacterium]|nr:serine hydrolase [Candidatus Promineifilaceae bacterium]
MLRVASRFLELLINGGQWENVRLLSQDTVKQMTTNHLVGDQYPVRFDFWTGMGYGLGVGVQGDNMPDEGWPAGTFGWIGTGGSSAWVFPEESGSVIALVQADNYFEPAFELMALVYEAVSN